MYLRLFYYIFFWCNVFLIDNVLIDLVKPRDREDRGFGSKLSWSVGNNEKVRTKSFANSQRYVKTKNFDR